MLNLQRSNRKDLAMWRKKARLYRNQWPFNIPFYSSSLEDIELILEYQNSKRLSKVAITRKLLFELWKLIMVRDESRATKESSLKKMHYQ